MLQTIQNIQSLYLSAENSNASLIEQLNRRLIAVANAGYRNIQEGKGIFISTEKLSDYYVVDCSEFILHMSEDTCVAGATFNTPYEKTNEVLTPILSAIKDFIAADEFKYANAAFNENSWNIKLVLPKDFNISFLYSTDNPLPKALFEPILLSSQSFKLFVGDGTYIDLYTDHKFTIAVSANDINSPIVTYYGLGVNSKGELLYNGITSEIQLSGRPGESQLFISCGIADINETSQTLIASSLTGGGINYKDSTEITEINYIGNGINTEPIYALVPRNLKFHENLCVGASLISIVYNINHNTEVTQTTYTAIFTYDGNIWSPVTINNDNDEYVFTFEQLLDTTKYLRLFKNSLSRYVSGEDELDKRYFEFDTIRFKESNKYVTQTVRADNTATGINGRFSITTVKYREQSLPVLALYYSNKHSDFKDCLLDSMADVLCGQLFDTKIYSDPNYRITDNPVNSCLPLIYLGSSAIYHPSIIGPYTVFDLSDSVNSILPADRKKISYYENTGKTVSWNIIPIEGNPQRVFSAEFGDSDINLITNSNVLFQQHRQVVFTTDNIENKAQLTFNLDETTFPILNIGYSGINFAASSTTSYTIDKDGVSAKGGDNKTILASTGLIAHNQHLFVENVNENKTVITQDITYIACININNAASLNDPQWEAIDAITMINSIDQLGILYYKNYQYIINLTSVINCQNSETISLEDNPILYIPMINDVPQFIVPNNWLEVSFR